MNGAWGRGRTYDLWLRRPLLFHWATQAIKKFEIMILAATYSYTSTRCTTIGTNWLNFCVRDGNRCTPAVITTKSLTSNCFFLFGLCLFCLFCLPTATAYHISQRIIMWLSNFCQQRYFFSKNYLCVKT